jgi:ABC-2 type transport system permease protein
MMTAATATMPPVHATAPARASALAGTGTLIRFILRRDRVRIPVWVLAIAFSVLGSVASFADTYPTAADRQARADVMDNAVAKLFTGPGHGLDNYTYGAMTANEMLPITAVAVALMSIFLVVRHTRAEEETGRADLVRATVVGRHATTAATVTVVGGANVLLCALLTVGLPASLEGLSTTGLLCLRGGTRRGGAGLRRCRPAGGSDDCERAGCHRARDDGARRHLCRAGHRRPW